MGALKTPATSGWEKPKFPRKQTGVSFGLEFDRNFRFRLEKDSKLGNMGSSLQFMVCRYMIELFSNKSGSNKIRKRENRSKFSAHLREFPEPRAIFLRVPRHPGIRAVNAHALMACAMATGLAVSLQRAGISALSIKSV